MARKPLSRRLITAAVSLLAALALAASALAGTPGPLARTGLTGCAASDYGQPFARWGDYETYSLVPNGGLERGGQGWVLGGGATVALGNEPFRVHGSADVRSLLLPGGAVAITPAVCITADHPSWRFFMRGDPRHALTAQVIFRNPDGSWRAPVVGALAGTNAWAPTPQLAVVANVLLAPGESTMVAFRLSTRAGSGNFRVDDVYVDPRHH